MSAPTYYDRSHVQGELNRFAHQWRQKLNQHKSASRKNFEIRCRAGQGQVGRWCYPWGSGTGR